MSLCLQVLLFLQAKTEEEHSKAQMMTQHQTETFQMSGSVDCDFGNQEGPIQNTRESRLKDLD